MLIAIVKGYTFRLHEIHTAFSRVSHGSTKLIHIHGRNILEKKIRKIFSQMWMSWTSLWVVFYDLKFRRSIIWSNGMQMFHWFLVHSFFVRLFVCLQCQSEEEEHVDERKKKKKTLQKRTSTQSHSCWQNAFTRASAHTHTHINNTHAQHTFVVAKYL